MKQFFILRIIANNYFTISLRINKKNAVKKCPLPTLKLSKAIDFQYFFI